MAYQVTRTIRKPNGRTYTYTFWQESYRVGEKVKTKYLGRGKRPLGLMSSVPVQEKGLRYIERQMEEYPVPMRERMKDAGAIPSDSLTRESDRLNRTQAKADAKVERARELFKESTGLTLPATPENPTPIERLIPKRKAKVRLMKALLRPRPTVPALRNEVGEQG